MDLTKIGDNEIGRMVRMAVTHKAQKRAAAETADRKIVAAFAREQDALLTAKDKVERPKRKAKGFLIAGKMAVPALDCSDVVLDEVAHDVARAIYNKARWCLGEKVLLDAESTTWRDLLVDHVRLSALALSKVEAPMVAATLDEAAKAKVTALAAVMQISEADAAKVIAKLVHA